MRAYSELVLIRDRSRPIRWVNHPYWVDKATAGLGLEEGVLLALRDYSLDTSGMASFVSMTERERSGRTWGLLAEAAIEWCYLPGLGCGWAINAGTTNSRLIHADWNSPLFRYDQWLGVG